MWAMPMRHGAPTRPHNNLTLAGIISVHHSHSHDLVTHQLTLTILYFNHTHNPHSEGALGVKPQRLRMVGQGP